MFAKDIFGVVKSLETRRRFPLLTFCHDITTSLSFSCILLFLLLLKDAGASGSVSIGGACCSGCDDSSSSDVVVCCSCCSNGSSGGGGGSVGDSRYDVVVYCNGGVGVKSKDSSLLFLLTVLITTMPIHSAVIICI